MPFQVIDRDGDLIEVEDGQPIPSGCRLHVPAVFMDSRERAAIEELRRRHPSKSADDDDLDDADDEIDGDDGDDADDEIIDSDPEAIRMQAYADFRRRIDTANVNRRNRVPKAPAPSDPSWQRPGPWRPRGRYGNDGTSDAALADAEGRRAAAYADFKVRIDTANINRRNKAPPAPAASDAAAGSSRLAEIERLQRVFARER
jgi:hypothetical protein